MCLGFFYCLSSYSLLCLPYEINTPIENIMERKNTLATMERLLVFGPTFWGFLGMVSGIAIPNFDNGVFVFGLFCCFGGLGYYSGPLSSAAKVISSRDASTLYAPVICVNLLNAFMWMLYGIALSDPLVWVPNMIGACLAIFQLILVGLYFKRSTDGNCGEKLAHVQSRSYDKFEDKDKVSTNIILIYYFCNTNSNFYFIYAD